MSDIFWAVKQEPSWGAFTSHSRFVCSRCNRTRRSDIYNCPRRELGGYVNYGLEFQVICSQWGSDADGVVFVFHQGVFGLAARLDGQASRQMWILLYEPVAVATVASLGEKCARACPLWHILYSLKTTPPHSVPLCECRKRGSVLLTFSEIALQHCLLSKSWHSALQLLD